MISAGLSIHVSSRSIEDDLILKQLNPKGSLPKPGNSELSKKLNQIFQRQEWTKSWSEVREVLSKAFVAKEFSDLRIDIRKILLQLDDIQSKELLNDMASKAIHGELPQLINQVLELFTSDELIRFGECGEKFEHERIKVMAESVKFLDALKHSDPSPSGIQKTYRYVMNFIHSTLDTILMAFSFFEIGQEPGSSWEASHMLQVYGQILGVPLILMTFLSTMMSTPAVAILTTIGILAGIMTTLLVYVKYFKPPPEKMKDVIDISAMVEKGETMPIIGYEEDVQKMLNYILSGEKPILVGKSRIGKSIRCIALAQYLYNNRNNPTLPDWVKRLRIKYTNAADMVGGYEQGGDKIARLRNRSEKFWPDILWFIDEGHIPVSPQYFAKSGTQFNILLDKLPSSMPHAMVATTDQGFTFILASDLRGRLKPILITEPEDQTILRILKARATIRAPEMDISEDVLKTIIEYSKKALKDQLQPNISLSILEEMVTSVRFAQMETPIEVALRNKRQQLADMSEAIFHGGIRRITKNIIAAREKCEQEIKVLEIERAKEIQLIKELVQLREKRLLQERLLNRDCLQILSNSPQIEANKNLKKYYFVIKLLDNYDLKIKKIYADIKLLHVSIKGLVKEEAAKKDDALGLPELNPDFVKKIIDGQAAMAQRIAAAAAPPSALFDNFRRQ